MKYKSNFSEPASVQKTTSPLTLTVTLVGLIL